MSAMDEEAIKRNTDCVYFLASPLTCKKGADCEYRHSDAVRMNPRDCYYWFGGNCINPNCTYRHPPIEAMSGTTAPAPIAPSNPAAPQFTSLNKTKVACFYFNNGYCAKGDKCTFMHGVFPGNIAGSTWKATKTTSSTSSDPQSSGKQVTDAEESNKNGKDTVVPGVPGSLLSNGHRTFKSPEYIATNAQNTDSNKPCDPVTFKSGNSRIAQPHISASFQPGNPVGHLSNNMDALNHQSETKAAPIVRSQQISKVQQDFDRDYTDVDSRQVEHDSSRTRSRMRPAQYTEERIQNGADHDDHMGGSSPGFDVLVDDGQEHMRHHEDAVYLPRLDIESGRMPVNGPDYNMYNKREYGYYDYDRPDQNMPDHLGYFDEEVRGDPNHYQQSNKHRGYDRHGRMQPNSFVERSVERPAYRERRSLPKEDEHVRDSGGDLRNMISKRRRNGGTVVDNVPKRLHLDSRHGELPYRRREWNDDSNQQDAVFREHRSRRLHGRNQLDSYGSKGRHCDSTDSVRERRLDKSRLRSPPQVRRGTDSFRGRSREIDSRKPIEGSNALESRIVRGRRSMSIEAKPDSVNFAGPKTLAQIKKEKNRCENSEEATGIMQIKTQEQNRDENKNRSGRMSYDISVEADFKGPKPLSAILQAKKRGNETRSADEGDVSSDSPTASNQKSVLHANSCDLEEPHNSFQTSDKKTATEVEKGEILAYGAVQSEGLKGSAKEESASYNTQGNLEGSKSSAEVHEKVIDPAEQKDEADQSNMDEEYADQEYELEEMENDEWDKDVDEMQDDEYLEDDEEEEAFSKKLGGMFS